MTNVVLVSVIRRWRLHDDIPICKITRDTELLRNTVYRNLANRLKQAGLMMRGEFGYAPITRSMRVCYTESENPLSQKTL